MPSALIQKETSRWQSRVGADKKVRRVPPVSSENDASLRQRAIAFSARFVKSLLVNTEFDFRLRHKF
jgi:hypothetical protein